MARFFKGHAAEVSPAAACCYTIFLKLSMPAVTGRFFPGDEGHEARQRPGYPVTP